MDAAGLIVGIVALYTACRDCYDFYTTVSGAEKESSAHLRELQIQQSILKAWGFHWQIQNEDNSEPDRTRRKHTKLHQYLSSNRFKVEGVFKSLSALADTLSNQEKLTKRYGIQLHPANAIQGGSEVPNNAQLAISDATMSDVKPVVSEVKNRLSVMTKLKWALKDKEKFKKLVAELRLHSESLYRLCPENAFESMNIYLTLECLARQESPAGLKRTSKLASQHAEVDEGSLVRKGYELLATTATLKASVNENRGKTEASDGSLPSLDEVKPEMWYLGKGLALFEGQVVYVEMRDYRGPPLDHTPEQKQRLKRRRRRARLSAYEIDDPQIYQLSSSDEDKDEEIERVRPADPRLQALIKNFYNTFQDANMMKSVYGLDIAGMIDHTEGEHKGHCSILYKLPGTIGVQSRERPAENLKLRAPMTLQSLLGKTVTRGIRSSLGARFELARKLVRAVCLLHSSGWLHKNIRAESVMFFPENFSRLQDDGYEVRIEIDVSKPSLMGYIFSRPDDIVIREDPPSTLQDHTEYLPTQPSERRRMGAVASHNTVTWDEPLYRDSQPLAAKTVPRNISIYGRNMLAKVARNEEAKETNISGFTLDYYQHPAKHADPKRLYRHAYDVYSLGILLIEVGLWENVNDSYYPYRGDGEEDYYERRTWICKQYLDRVRWQCGDTYADVVLRCLMIDSSDDEVAKASERELCVKIIADLENCQA
ncbi:hypothetical protein NW752_004206 [Fusarium irregulare]|uniref:Prion-inhibition and propagation HeLo domain-containing protein n=1 Tax=Fusarium irregulare TaxID=2494466 RepID=A0A9W8PPF8_9HYPO|nr:hypothetical protein NW766_007105 [Fusarium irregulare]KAJ4021199.1 hypothetical protein NW752_004206 [Fusarium irregulare]